jgi:regulator of replication initiation timing
MKEEAAVAKIEEARKKEKAAKEEQEANMLKETSKDMVARWWKDGCHSCSRDSPLKM